MAQQVNPQLMKKIELFIGSMTPNDRLEVFMDKDGKMKYESRIVDKGMV